MTLPKVHLETTVIVRQIPTIMENDTVAFEVMIGELRYAQMIPIEVVQDLSESRLIAYTIGDAFIARHDLLDKEHGRALELDNERADWRGFDSNPVGTLVTRRAMYDNCTGCACQHQVFGKVTIEVTHGCCPKKTAARED